MGPSRYGGLRPYLTLSATTLTAVHLPQLRNDWKPYIFSLILDIGERETIAIFIACFYT